MRGAPRRFKALDASVVGTVDAQVARYRAPPSSSTLHPPPCFCDSLPQPLEIRRPQRSIVETVARPAAFAPDHATVVWPDWSVEPRGVQGREHAMQVDVAQVRRMRHLIEFLVARPLHVSTMSKVNAPARGESSGHSRQIIRGIGAERSGAERHSIRRRVDESRETIEVLCIRDNSRQTEDDHGGSSG